MGDHLHDHKRGGTIYILCGIVSFVAILVLVGWTLDIELLKRIQPAFVAMNPITAVSFILLSLAIASGYASRQTKNTSLIRTSYVCAAIVAAVGLLKIIELASGIHIGIDQLLFSDKLSPLGEIPNRIAPNTATNFVLLGSAFIMLGWKVRGRPLGSYVCMAVSFLLASMAITGYLFNITALYVVTVHIPMAIHTATLFLLLVIALFVSEPSHEFIKFFTKEGAFYLWFRKLRIAHKLAFSFGALIILLVISSVSSYVSINNIQSTQLPLRANIKAVSATLAQLQAHEGHFYTEDIHNPENALFFEEGASVNVDNWEKTYNIFLFNLKTIRDHPDNGNFTPLGNELSRLAAEDRTKFLAIVELYRQRGFTDFGLEGEMRAAARELEDYLSNTESHLMLEHLRINEKDFFQRKQEIYLTEFRKGVVELQKRLASNAAATALLADYSHRFEQIVDIEKKIGLTNEEGLRGDLALLYAKTQPLLARGETLILGLTDRSISRLNKLNFLLTTLFIVFAVGIAFLFAHLLLNSLRTLASATHKLASGDFNSRVTGLPGDEIGAVGVAFNQMAEKLAESYKTLQQTNAKDEAILTGIGDGVFVLDVDGKIQLFNKMAEQISGFASKDVLKKHFKEVLIFKNESTGENNTSFIDKAFGGEKAHMANHTVLIRKDGDSVAVADSAAPIWDDKGKISGVVVVFRDVTQERVVDKAKTEFVSLASHQLRTPLSTINWYAEMLLAGDAGKLNKEQKQYLNEIYTGNQRMVELVNALLNVSRVDLGTFSVEPSPTDVVKLAQAIVKDLEPKIFERKIGFTEKYEPDIPVMSVDPKLMRIVIENLLSNAIKYTPEQGSVSIILKKTDKDLQMEISDTGYGIPEAQQEKIFTKLFRADNVREKETEGTGLGLYLVQAIVIQSGGTIRFDSVEGKGTTFFVSLPLAGMAGKKGTKGLE